ncbi:hypothetical protein HCH_06388 [Hahella chejuensis KCTC 2396]|uniref:Uncharacterized protein n=1 Tax=Hahella chejuensis (strain KCTC 2396) TaxID=349521 RepID=Q2S8J1_HAHCH|nr:hypothetical protein [Hahella chejuensis]ABC33033.1 hypothetical protein HCH_06388 [Hahella chejuensis KCTC 2396]
MSILVALKVLVGVCHFLVLILKAEICRERMYEGETYQEWLFEYSLLIIDWLWFARFTLEPFLSG